MNNDSQRFYLLDLQKLIVLLAIQTLHVWEFIFFEDLFTLDSSLSVVYDPFNKISRCFANGGQVLVGIIFFLFGYRHKSRSELLTITAFAFLGQMILGLVFSSDGALLSGLEWDIYAFIALATLLLQLFPMDRRGSPFIMVLSFLLLCIPTSLWQSHLPEGLIFDILSGRRSSGNPGAWAPLPWLALSFLFFSLGDYFRKHKSELIRWHPLESIIWPLLLIASLPFLGAYFSTPLGPNYYAFAFNRPPHILWTNLLPHIFWMRLALLEPVQKKASHSNFLKWLSRLHWTRHLGTAYLLGIIYLGFGMNFEKEMGTIPGLFDVFYVSIMPVAEIGSRIIYWAGGLRKTRAPSR